MSLKILKVGMLDSIQDPGRYGYQQFGINPTGCMDKYAAAIANSLVGNDISEAVIEIHFPGPSILFERSVMIAITGADLNAMIDGRSIPVNHPVIVGKGMTLQFQSIKNKNRCYVAIKGGIRLKSWLDSYSTNLKAEAGGYNGRKLMKDDVLELNKQTDSSSSSINALRILPWQANENFDSNNSNEIFVIKGSEWGWADTISQEKFLKNPFYISHNSDRMAYKLASEPLYSKEKAELISSGVTFGTIQLLPDGQVIVLMADHQTTGGYPRLGTIITAHFSKLAQMKAGDEIRFKFIDHQSAEALLLKQKHHLHQLQIACKLRLENYTRETRNQNN